MQLQPVCICWLGKPPSYAQLSQLRMQMFAQHYAEDTKAASSKATWLGMAVYKDAIGEECFNMHGEKIMCDPGSPIEEYVSGQVATGATHLPDHRPFV